MTSPLFKFGSAEGIMKILESESIFITSPLDLNDPFEMRPAWTQQHHERHQLNEAKRNEIMAGAPLYVAKNGGHPQRIGKMPKLEMEPIGHVEDQYGIADMHNTEVFHQLHKRFRVLSWVRKLFVSEAQYTYSAPEATLMWAHYADSFQGACLVVDPRKMNNGIKRGGYRISYKGLRRSFPPDYYDTILRDRINHGGISFSGVGEHQILVPDSSRGDIEVDWFIKLLTSKSPAWKYENEVRFLYDLATPPAEHERQSKRCDECVKFRKASEECMEPEYRDTIKLPSNAIIGVIFGVDMLPQYAEAILNVLGQERYRHAKTSWSSIHSCSYEIQYSVQSADYIVNMQEIRSADFNKAKQNWIGDKLVSKAKGKTLDTIKARENLERKRMSMGGGG